MSAQTIRNALGLLQDDSENETAWTALESELSGSSAGVDLGMASDELAKLLASARRAHETRREFFAVAKLLRIESRLAEGRPEEVDLLAELGRVLDEDLLHDAEAMEVYKRILVLRPRDVRAEEAIEKSEAKRGRWSELVVRYVDEAKSTAEGAFRSSLLVSAAEVAFRYGLAALGASKEKGSKKKLEALKAENVARLKEALTNDPRNRRAQVLLERMLSESGKFDELAEALDAFASNAASKEEAVSGLCRLARIRLRKQNAWDLAAAAYARVIDLSPGHPEATSALVDLFTEHEKWDELATLYEEQLASGVVRGTDEAGALYQAAMVHWKMRGKSEAADPHFEKLRKLDPTHQGVLNFYREWYTARGETAQLTAILTDAQRALPEGAQRSEIAVELAKLAEEGSNAQKAIEQWRALLRQDAKNVQAREALKRLYRQTSAWAQLTEIYRGDLERLGADDTEAKLASLREIAVIYRDHLKNDAARATVLSQIVALDPTDLPSLRQLGDAYESLQRWRDLLLVQSKQAELEKNPASKAELYRAIARRWLEQFSNVQNAVEAYEKLNLTDPADPEAIEKLRELYTKRRAFRALYELIERQAGAEGPGEARREKWAEMAKLCSERLDRGTDAIRLYKQILDEEPSAVAIMDALEKQAEREKDFETVADVLERRVITSDSEANQLAALQKLGSIYSDRLSDLPKAIRTWRRVLVLVPGQAKAMRVVRDGLLALGDLDGLTELYAAQGEWDGLADVLTSAADKATDDASKVELSFRAASVYESKLAAPDRAAKAYERVLSVRPTDARAALALATFNETGEKWAKLPPLYEILLGHADAVASQVSLLEKLANVVGGQLGDTTAAFAYRRRAYELAPREPKALAHLAKAASDAGQWEAFVATMAARQRAEDVDAGEVRALRARTAHVLGTELGREDDAVHLYRGLIEEDDARDPDLVREFDTLLKRTGRRDDLRWLFEHRASKANTAQKLDLLAEWASIEEDVFTEPKEAVAIHQRVLAIVPEHGGSLRALARLLRGLGDFEGARAALLRDRDHRSGAERAAREVEIARISSEDLGRPADALHAAERALGLVPGFEPALSVLESLLKFPETRARSAELLDDIYGRLENWGPKAEMLTVRLATSAAREDRIAITTELVQVYTDKLGKPEAAFDVLVRAVSEYPTALLLWDSLANLANKTERLSAFADAIAGAVPPQGESGLPPAIDRDLAERAATLLEDRLGDVERARLYWERVLVHEPTNESVFARLRHLLTTGEQWADLEAAYERTIAANEASEKKVELLTEIALLCEDITSDRAKATVYYERILQIDPANAKANASLDTLYQASEQWGKLAALLEASLARGVDATPAPNGDVRLRLPSIYLRNLQEPGLALSHLEVVLDGDPKNAAAIELAESLLEVPALRARTAEMLERAFSREDDARNLARVIAIRLESAADDDLQKSLHHRLAELRDVRLHDPSGAFAALEPLAALDPADRTVRGRLIELGRIIGASSRAVRALEASSAKASSPALKAEILVEAAELAAEDPAEAGDAGAAERLYRAALTTVGDDAVLALPICRSLERIYSTSNEPKKLCAILRDQLRFESDPVALQDLRGRVAELRETAENDLPGAIEAWRARLDADLSDEVSQAALARLYEAVGQWADLVWVLRLRQTTTTDPEFRKQQRLFAATVLADKLTNVADAIGEYQAVIDEFGPDRTTLANLEVLFEIADRWADLAGALEAELALATDTPDKIALLSRLATVRNDKLADIPGALDAYRQALTLDPSHGASRRALEAYLLHESAASDAAALLQPLYEADGDQVNLLKTIDIEMAHIIAPADKLVPLDRAVKIAEESLKDASRAFTYASKGVQWSATDPDVRRWIDLAARLATTAGTTDELITLLRRVEAEIPFDDEIVYVAMLIASLLRSSAKGVVDWTVAKAHYERALSVRPSNPEALLALQSLLEENDQWALVADVLQRRVEISVAPDERRELSLKVAEITESKLGNSEEALAVYERVLDDEFSEAVCANVDRLYRKHGKWALLVELIERQLAADGLETDARAQLFFELGSVFANELSDIDRALDAYEEALQAAPEHAPTILALEQALRSGRAVTRTSEMLERVYIARFDWRNVIFTIEARLAACEDLAERRELLHRLSKLQEEQEENYPAALATFAKLLSMDPGDDSTWAELERLAKVGNAEKVLGGIFGAEVEKLASIDGTTLRLAERAGELLAKDGQSERALAIYRRAFDVEPSPTSKTFAALDSLLSLLKKDSERAALYTTALELTSDPHLRAGFLHTKAQIEETGLDDRAAAIGTWQEAFDLDIEDAVARDALIRLFTQAERWRDLADLLRRKAEASVSPTEQVKWRLSLASHLATRLADSAGAVFEYEAVLNLASSVPSDVSNSAISALESLLTAGEQKARVIEVLRPIYEQRDDFHNVIRICGEQAAIATSPSEKIAAWRHAAELWETRSLDVNRAFDTLRHAYLLDPSDGEVRDWLDRLAGEASRWDDLVSLFEQALQTDSVIADVATQRVTWASLATIHDKRRDDPRRALAAWASLFRLDETDLAPLEEMDALATLLSDWATLAHVLERKAELVVGDDAIAATWRRLGETRRDMLDDAAGALHAYERAAEVEPGDAYTLDCVIDLAERAPNPRRLVELYRRRVELCGTDDGDRQFALLVAAADQCKDGLGDLREAIQLLSQARDLRPTDAELLDRLDSLYASLEMWAELVSVLRQKATLATDPDVRFQMEKRVGLLLSQHLNEPGEALFTLREVVAQKADDDVIRELRSIGDKFDEHRSEIADILETVLREASRFRELIDVYELRLRAEGEPTDRASTLLQMAEVFGTVLGSPDESLGALLRALRETSDNAEIHARIEQVAKTVGPRAWGAYADALSELARGSFDAEVSSDLFNRLGVVAEIEQGDLPRAAEAYKLAAERIGDSQPLLRALDRVLLHLQDWPALAEVLERRIVIEESEAEQAELYHRMATLQIQQFGDRARGLASLRSALERVPSHPATREALVAFLDDDELFGEAFDALEGVYRNSHEQDLLADLYRRKIARAANVSERLALHQELVRILEYGVRDLPSAQRAAEAAMRDAPAEHDAVAEVARLANQTGDWTLATRALDEILSANDSLEVAVRVGLYQTLASWRRNHTLELPLAEAAIESALSLEPENLELFRELESMQRQPGRERDLVATLRRIAKVEANIDEKRALLHESAELAESALGDAALEELSLRDILAEDEGDAWAIERLSRLRERAGDNRELVSLLLRLAELAGDGTQVLSLRHRAADVLAESLGDLPRATALYEEILDIEPEDTKAIERLRTLYGRQGRDKDLANLLRRLIDVATDADVRAQLRYELAVLSETRLNSPADAIDLLRAVLDELPSHTEAILALSRLYENAGRDADMADLLRVRVDAAAESGDAEGELRLLLRLADLQERRLDDPRAALDSLDRAAQRDPRQKDVHEAIARIGLRTGDHARAAEALWHLLDLLDGPEAVACAVRIADLAESLNDNESVERALSRGLKVSPSASVVRERLQRLYETEGRFADLAELLVGDADLRASLPGSNDQVVALLRKAANLYVEKLGNSATALALFERAATLAPNDRELLLMLCDTYLAEQKFADAASALERVIASFGGKRSKEVSIYYHRLGGIFRNIGDLQGALTQFDQAFKIDPGSVSVLRDLGMLAFETGDLDRAQKTFRALLLQRLDGGSGTTKNEVFFYLGEISLRLGDRAKAQQMFERAIENDATDARSRARLAEMRG